VNKNITQGVMCPKMLRVACRRSFVAAYA